MVRKTTMLDADAIRQMIADRYDVDKKDVKWEYVEPTEDGIYSEPADVIFSFTEEIDDDLSI